MHRVTDIEKRERMRAALDRLPPPLRQIAKRADLFTEDPIFAGFRRGRFTTTDALEAAGWGRPDEGQWPHLRSVWEDGAMVEATVIMPPGSIIASPIEAYIHELGHVIDHHFADRLRVPFVTEWAQSTYESAPSEAFAEWICAWTCDEYRNVRDYAERSEYSRALWATLASGRFDNLDQFT